METKLMKKTKPATIPAGVLEGTEAFWIEEDLIDQKWLIHNRQSMHYCEAPVKVQNQIAMMFLNDKKSKNYLENVLGITAFSKAFERWYKCVVGALDGTPDFVNGSLYPDAFNSSCKNYSCTDRGKLCSVKSGLKYYEVATLAMLKQGFTIDDTARKLYMSVPAIKSRIEKIKEKFETTNMASTIARACELGI